MKRCCAAWPSGEGGNISASAASVSFGLLSVPMRPGGGGIVWRLPASPPLVTSRANARG